MTEICRRLNVLVAEDNPLFRKLMGCLLDDRGYAVYTVCDGRQAVDWYSREEVDLIVLDVDMPGMDGISATSEIRRLEAGSGRRVPIVGVTEHPSAADRERCLQAGMDSYMAKPLFPDTLFSVVDQALGVEPVASTLLPSSDLPFPSIDVMEFFPNPEQPGMERRRAPGKPMRILLAEDDETTRAYLSDLLTEWGHLVIEAADGDAAWHILQQPDPPRLALLDQSMPGFSGLQLCEEIRKRPLSPYVYVILVTGRGEKSDVVCGMLAGADDYLVKPVHPEELRVRVQAGRRVIESQEELLYTQEVFRLQATLDPLTGVMNRRSLMDLLSRELSRQDRQGTPLSLLMLDFDYFKSINDTHGHATGDAVLLQATRRMRMMLRSYDAIGRYGGEEFVIVLPGANAENAARLAERLLRRVASEALVEVAGRALFVTVSCGVSTRTPRQDCDAHSLVAAADRALYRAKDGGRNCVHLAAAADYQVATAHVC